MGGGISLRPILKRGLNMEHCKLQIGCLVILLYTIFIYVRECKRNHVKLKDTLFFGLSLLGVINIILDGITVYTVNHLDTVNPTLNLILHILFLSSIDFVIFTLFLYMLIITGIFPEKKIYRLIMYIPFILNILLVILSIGSLEYKIGEVTNYSMGIPAYTCYFMVAIYITLSIIIFFKRWNYIESHKRMSIFTYLVVSVLVMIIQMIFPETLISSIAVTLYIVSVYMNQENLAFNKLSKYHDEMVMGFATLIENRDNSTGGHVKRTSVYVKLIAEELRNRGYYNDILTKDYITNLLKSAPMHDIGKISVPDAILQKPGKLTNEEFEIMKLHSVNGGKIIKETFKNFSNEEYLNMAYKVARYHHEKWNGRGYPDGLKEEEIPLCARIMAVADVFDAVSEKRCYRDAMPLNKCFEIIQQGSNKDFDPLIVEIFLSIRDEVETVHNSFINQN